MKKAKTAQKAKKQKKPQTLAGKIIKTVLSGIAALVIIFSLFSLDGVISPYKRMISSLAGGYKQSWDNSKVDATGLDLEYNKPDFSKNDIASAESALSKQISDEGTVLLKNDGLMPFNPGTKFSFFGSSSFGSTSLLTSVLGGEGADLKTAFESAGLAVNDQLLEFYQKGAGSKYNLGAGSIGFGANEDFAINECPLSVVLSEEGLAESFKGTVPVYVMKRIAGEGRDAPRSMYNHTLVKEDQALNYFEPNSTEREILKHLNDNYPGIVLVVNSNYALPLGWVSEYENIKAVLFAPSMNSLGDIFAGNANPSGRTVDTFAANLLDSPAAQNYGDYAYLNPDGTQTKYNYVTYQEGIYVGYKYYETRYEDIVLDQGNPGDFKYDDEVVYPFGFGLSYTDFEWSGFSVSNPNNNNEDFLVSLEVKNTGAVAGKDVVEIYAQSPYTDYDRENGVEKPAVSLVAFAKTSNLLPGESETVTASFRREQLKSYDSKNAKTFILEPGTYYITAGKDAHSAVNNILASKGKTVSGNSDLVAAYEPGLTEIDMTYSRDSFSGAEITNLFDEAAGDAKYLSRNDWIGTFPSHDGQVTSIISTWGNEINGT
ncbi:MAG: fibronectin type III-like domain-contianing protein, partial [Clostridiales bacterium]|nr:fibronectin type III-like domain-contianing protein [Clostridiales bacterium]